MTKQKDEAELDPAEVAKRRDEAVKRMIATPPKTQTGALKRAPKGRALQKPGKRGS